MSPSDNDSEFFDAATFEFDAGNSSGYDLGDAKGISFDPQVQICGGGIVPLAAGDGYWDTLQYETDTPALSPPIGSRQSMMSADQQPSSTKSLNLDDLDDNDDAATPDNNEASCVGENADDADPFNPGGGTVMETILKPLQHLKRSESITSISSTGSRIAKIANRLSKKTGASDEDDALTTANLANGAPSASTPGAPPTTPTAPPTAPAAPSAPTSIPIAHDGSATITAAATNGVTTIPTAATGMPTGVTQLGVHSAVNALQYVFLLLFPKCSCSSLDHFPN